ncbi:MAG: hypothetical protein ACI97A_003464, partial [Planctomycetota bacterium]
MKNAGGTPALPGVVATLYEVRRTEPGACRPADSSELSVGSNQRQSAAGHLVSCLRLISFHSADCKKKREHATWERWRPAGIFRFQYGARLLWRADLKMKNA